MSCQVISIILKCTLAAVLLTTPLFAKNIQCRLQVSAIDSKNGSVIDQAEFTLVDHHTLKSTKRRSKGGIAEFDYIEKGKYSLKVAEQGFFTSISNFPAECTSSPFKFTIKIYPGESEKEVFVLDPNPVIDSDGKIIFDVNHTYLLGKSWPFPKYAGGCRSDCEVTVAVEIDNDGNVTSAKAKTGNQDLWKPSEDAASKSKFRPVFFNGGFVPVKAVMRYVFR